jgi:hypothetical protein
MNSLKRQLLDKNHFTPANTTGKTAANPYLPRPEKTGR